MDDRGANPKEKIPCPKCGNRVQRDGMRRHDYASGAAEYASGAAETHSYVPVLLEGQPQDLLHLQRLEESSDGHSSDLSTQV